MRCNAILALFTLLFSTTVGCSICATGYMDDYATVGGKWPRGNPTDGRVGSPFSDAGAGLVEQAVYMEDEMPYEMAPETVPGGSAPLDQSLEGYEEIPAEPLDGDAPSNAPPPIAPTEPGIETSYPSDNGVIILGDDW